MIKKMAEEEIYYFKKGLLYNSYDYFGAHLSYDKKLKSSKCTFRVYAENAQEVYVFGDFNQWEPYKYKMNEIKDSKIFEIEIEGIEEYASYKYLIIANNYEILYKADPYAFYSDIRPQTNSKVFDHSKYVFQDQEYINSKTLSYDKPVLIYEMHLGSFKYTNDQKERVSYREIADFLIEHLKKHHFTHVEFLPLYEHPLDDSWGYMTTGYFAPTSRFGNPDDLKFLIDKLHQNHIGVIFDFVVSHICKDAFGLYNFDGNYLYDYKEEEIRENREWGTANLDLGKGCTQSLLFSSALFFLKEFHVDGFRIDAVSNIIYYLGNSERGMNEGALQFLRKLSDLIFEFDERILYIAEDSTSFPNVTKRSKDSGLGFNYKWNMGFMNDTLKYFTQDPIFRKYHHNNITFGMMYHYSENFMLAYSHDEVVHGKKSLLDKMPGNYEQKFANLRTLLGLFFTYPGKKTLFMGFEFGQFIEWNIKRELDWFLLDYDMHKKFNQYIVDLTGLYVTETSLYAKDFSPDGFSWIDCNNQNQSIFSYYRYGEAEEKIITIINCTPNHYEEFEIGVEDLGIYEEILNSNQICYGGYGNTNENCVLKAYEREMHHQKYTLKLMIPGLSIILLKFKREKKEE